MRYQKTSRKIRGFTLIEILVALIILAIALTAVLKTVSDNINTANDLRTRIAAYWAAENIIANMQAGLLASPSDSISQGETTELNQKFYWHARLEDNSNPEILRIYVEVAPQKDSRPAARLIGFIRKEPPVDTQLEENK